MRKQEEMSRSLRFGGLSNKKNGDAPTETREVAEDQA